MTDFGTAPALADFSAVADTVAFEAPLWRDFPALPGLGVQAGVAFARSLYPGSLTRSFGQTAYAELLAGVQEAWGVIGRLPGGTQAGDVLFITAGDVLVSGAAEKAWRLSIYHDGSADLFEVADSPQNPTHLGAGTFLAGDRVGLAVTASQVIVWLLRGALPLVAVAIREDARARDAGYITFGSDDSHGTPGGWTLIGGGSLAASSYATREDLLARAGRLQDAWGATTQPSLDDLDSYLSSTAAEIDAIIAAHGFATPVTDPQAAAALVNANADMALLLALRSTWPGGGGPAGLSDLLKDVEARDQGYRQALAEGSIAALLYLASSAGATEQGGASDFWTTDGVEYDYWENVTSSWVRYWTVDPWGVPPSQQPAFRRDERF